MFRSFRLLQVNSRQVLHSVSGNFGILTAILLPVLGGSVGLAVDYLNAANEATRLQLAVDAAALAIAKDTETLTDDQAIALAKAMLVGNKSKVSASFSVSRSGSIATVNGSGSVSTTFARFLGVSTINVVRTATADVNQLKYEIAMALDTTGSMEGAKMTALKSAATQLVDDLDAQIVSPDNLKFGLIPFSAFVNVGAGFGPKFANGLVTQNPATWLDYDGNSPIPQKDFATGVSRFPFFHHMKEEWAGCVESRPVVHGVDLSVTDTPPSQSDPATLYVPAFGSDEPSGNRYMNSYLSDTPATIDQSTWSERHKRYGANYVVMPNGLAAWAASEATWPATTPDNSVSYFYSNYHYAKGPNFLCKTRPIVPLSNNYTAVKQAIADLFPAGSTNIAEGAAWGWRVLSSGAPFTEGRPSTQDGVKKILILLTDGTNSFGHTYSTLGSAYSSYGYLADGRLGTTSTDPAVTTDLMNRKTLATCQNAKDSGVEIYTILLEEDNSVTSSLLKQCASSENKYISVPDNSQLANAFTAIKSGITSSRLSN